MLAYCRRRLLGSERWIDALLVVQLHDGEELFRVGGCWDSYLRCYVARSCAPHVIRLEASQTEVGHDLKKMVAQVKAGDSTRARALILGGNRGSGKTFFAAGVTMVVVALEWPGDLQFGVNITTKQKAECIEAIEVVARPEWIVSDTSDLRDPRTIFCTNSVIEWHTSKNARALRQAGRRIRHVLINEGQDQPEAVAINSIAAIRNLGGFISIATNPPTAESGDWVAALWLAIEAGEINCRRFLLDNKLNSKIDEAAVGDIGPIIRVISQESHAADVLGVFQLSGRGTYPAFKATPLERGGHIFADEIPTHWGWEDITVELTTDEKLGLPGFPNVCGLDFQKRPGIVGSIARLYRTGNGAPVADDPLQLPPNSVVLAVYKTIHTRGVESDFSQALHAAGFDSSSVLLVGDATGARQDAEHRFGNRPTSFRAMQEDGWIIVPPMYHWKRQTPWNPLVAESRAQMHEILTKHQVIFSERCKEPGENLPSLVDSMRRSKVGPKGGLLEAGDYQHGPDGIRYLVWRFLPRPRMKAPPKKVTSSAEVLAQLRKFKIGRPAA